MEFKVLSDQLNSAFEVIPTPQGDFQDELLSEPVFRDLSTFRVFHDGRIGFSTNLDVLNKQEKVLDILKGCYNGFEVTPIRGSISTDTSEKNVIGFEDPNLYGKWEIMVCQCRMSQEERREKLKGVKPSLEMLRNTCDCATFTVKSLTEDAESTLRYWLTEISKDYHECDFFFYFPFDTGSLPNDSFL
eukprot:GHVP01022259.1.p1 GENE.GHVP01022259.1~~GHVP01022259.1.p1  ORF type:complete len:198 (+),score=27.27 GHVP01022259.1:32-595(+)